MGLLNDAIREHLELMRRHGAADAEVQRLEHEALGPVRRRGEYAPDPDELDTSVAAVPADATSVADEPPTEVAFEQPVMPEPAGHEPEVEQMPPSREEPAAVPMREPEEPTGSTTASGDDDLWLDEDEAAPTEVLETPNQQTTAFSAADVAAARGEGDPEAGPEEDVLEETPEFLQETPEHERLWFEQRPPRGFDFDQ